MLAVYPIALDYTLCLLPCVVHRVPGYPQSRRIDFVAIHVHWSSKRY